MARLSYVYEKFMVARNSMIGSALSPRQQLQSTVQHLGRLQPKDFPEGLRGDFGQWAITYFEVDSLDNFNTTSPLRPQLTEDEVQTAIDIFADQMWAKVSADADILSEDNSQPFYDWT